MSPVKRYQIGEESLPVKEMLKEDITLLINAELEISGRQVIRDDHKVYRATNF